MSIMITTLFPILLSGAAAAQTLPQVFTDALVQSRTHYAARAAAVAPPVAVPVAAPVIAPAPAKPVPVKATAPASRPGPAVIAPVITPAIAPPAAAALPPPVEAAPPAAELIRVQAPGSPALDRAAIIDRAGKALETVKTAEGQFSQVDPAGAQSSGKFYISRPGKVRFEYKAPEAMFIVSDGVSVSIEEPKRKAYDAVPLSSTPLNLFLRSNVDLRRDGSVTDVSSSNGSHFVTLKDRTGEAEGSMTLEFRASDFELLGWRALDGAGGETRVRLTDVKTNGRVSAALFVVRDPSDDGRR